MKVLGLAVCLVLTAGAFYFVWELNLRAGDSLHERSAFSEPSPEDMFFRMVAHDFDVPHFCDKISPTAAERGAGLSPSAGHVDLTRSECYFDVAVANGDTALCAKIVPVDGYRPYYSKDLCFERASRGGKIEAPRPGTFGPLHVSNFGSIMQRLGYSPADVPEYREYPDEDGWTDLYYNIVFGEMWTKDQQPVPEADNEARRADFLARIRANL